MDKKELKEAKREYKWCSPPVGHSLDLAAKALPLNFR